MESQIVLVVILLGLTAYLGSKRTTGFVQWLIIAFFVFLIISFYGTNQTGAMVVFACLVAAFYMKSRLRQGKKNFPFLQTFKTPKRKINPSDQARYEAHVKKGLHDTVQMLSDFEKEQYRKTVQDLGESKASLANLKREIESLRAENESLINEQSEQRRVEEATPRLRHYQNLTRKKLEEESSDLSKMKEKRLREEQQRLREENRELKKNQRK